MLSIGELSHRTGVKVPTIRYYEKQGLIEAPERSAGNQRRYEPEALQRLSFIKHGRELGLTLDAIAELIDLSEDPERSCAEADRIAREHLSAVRSKIDRLSRLERELTRIASKCEGRKIGECYVIHALSDHSLCEDEH